MNLQLAATNPTAQQPPPEILPPNLQPVEQFDQELRVAAKAYRMSSMRIAYWGFRMRLSDGWTAFGYEPGPRGEEAYRDDLGVPRSSWYRLVRIGQALHQIPLADLERIPLANAQSMLDVEPEIMHDYAWTWEAKTLSADKFAELVSERNRAIGSKRDPLVYLGIKVPVLAKQAIEKMLDVFTNKHHLSSRGQSLELLVADRYDRANLLAAADKAIQLISAVAVSLEKRGIKGEEVAWLKMAAEVWNESCSEAIQATRKTPDGDKEGGRA